MSDLAEMLSSAKTQGIKEGRADVLSELLSKDWWNPQQRMVMEDWLKQTKEQEK